MRLLLAIISAILIPGPLLARADIVSLSDSAVHDALSESVPTAFAPQGSMQSIGLEDFSVRWVGQPIPGVSVRLVPSSLQWVRVEEVLVIPRAILRVRAIDVSGGNVRSGGFTQPISGADALADVPVALLSGADNPIQISVLREGRLLQGRVQILFQGKGPGPSIGVDTSCSRFHVQVQAPRFSRDERMNLGCRLVISHGSAFRTSTLELYVFWDRSQGSAIADRMEPVSVNGIPTPPTRPELWVLSLRPEPGMVRLAQGADAVTIRYSIPEHLHYGSLGMGLGPYAYQYFDPATSVSSVAPLLTLYGSYFFKETIRVIAFDATTLSDQWVTDFGVYLSSEYARVFDNRVAFHVMLGAHAIGFSSSGGYYLRVGAPQGLDVVYSDAFHRNRNLSMGGFVFPSVSGTSYYNFWLRWGSPSVFAEVNYILWTEQISSQTVFSRSIGLSLGFPVASFL